MASTETSDPQIQERVAYVRHNIVELIPVMECCAMSLTKNRSVAEDLLQETLCKALTKAQLFVHGRNLRPWLFVIMLNTFRQQLRKKNPILYEDLYTEEDIPIEEILGVIGQCIGPRQGHGLELESIFEIIGTLPHRQRHVIYLLAIGKTIKEMATTLQISQGAIKSITHRTRSVIKSRLAELEDDIVSV